MSDPRIAGPAKFSSSVIEGSVNYFATVDAQSPYAGATADKPYVIEAQMSGNRASSAAPRSQLETAQRDPEAERLIADGLRRAPHAVYALVQTVLLQDEALKRANARIEELQVQTNAATEPEQRPASFLDSMREALGGRAHGSVPSVRRAGANQSQGQPPQPGYPGAPGFGSGGSFLGTAASAAAGVIGGSLLLDGVRSMFGHHLGAASASPFARGDDKFATYADREQDRQQDLADDDREQDRQQDLADEDAQQDAEQDLADEDAQQRRRTKISPTKTLNKTASKT